MFCLRLTAPCLLGILLVGSCVSRPTGRVAGDLVLVDGGESDYTIAVSASATAPERFAGEELQRYLSKISSVELAISERPGPVSIVVGLGPESPLNESLRDLPEDSFLIQADGRQLHLGGNSPRGTLYSVYYFLEKYLDCGWIRPGVDVVPKKDRIAVDGHLRELRQPHFSYRNLNLYPFIADRNLRNVDWATKNHLNWIHACVNSSNLWEELDSRNTLVPEIEKRGLLLNYGGHTFHKWVSPERYFDQHPEYFSLIDGKRDSRQLCISNQEVTRTAAENINTFLDTNPEVDMVDVWLSDTIQWCQCSDCNEMEGEARPSAFSVGRGFDQSLHSHSNSNMKFINQIAGRVAEKHPSVLVQSLAYFFLIDAPTEVKPAPNVMVGFAPINRQPSRDKIDRTGYWYPIYDPRHEVNRSRLEEIKKWLQIIDPKRFFTYEYYSHYSTALAMINRHSTAENLEQELIDPSRRTFHVYSDAISKDIWYYTQLGMEGIGTEEWDWNEINMYLYPRLAWEPGRSSTSLVEDYCRRAYGQAAGPMSLHWLILQEARERYPIEKERCLALLKQAETMTQDPDVLGRISQVREIWSHVSGT